MVRRNFAILIWVILLFSSSLVVFAEDTTASVTINACAVAADCPEGWYCDYDTGACTQFIDVPTHVFSKSGGSGFNVIFLEPEIREVVIDGKTFECPALLSFKDLLSKVHITCYRFQYFMTLSLIVIIGSVLYLWFVIPFKSGTGDGVLKRYYDFTKSKEIAKKDVKKKKKPKGQIVKKK